MGRILCCSFLPIADGKRNRPYTFRLDDKQYKADDPIDDRKICVAIRDELEKYHMVIGWNSKLFDHSFLDARLAQVGERPFNKHLVLDMMWYAGQNSLRIGSRKLDNVAKFFKLKSQKTPIDWDDWKRAALGDKEAMDKVVVHCEADVKTLAEAYWAMLPMVKTIHR